VSIRLDPRTDMGATKAGPGESVSANFRHNKSACPNSDHSRESLGHAVSASISIPIQRSWLEQLCTGRPHQEVATEHGGIYLRRWFLVPHNRFLNIYLHHFVDSDDPTALHDHPWWFASISLRHSYLEILPNASRRRRPGTVAVRRAQHRHRITLLTNPDGTERSCWTILVTGPRVRHWGFWSASPGGHRFVPWQQFGPGGCNPHQPKQATPTASDATATCVLNGDDSSVTKSRGRPHGGKPHNPPPHTRSANEHGG